MNSQQFLSVHLPQQTTQPYPTLLLFHAGGFVTGSKESFNTFSARLSQRGFAVVTANYRLRSYPIPVKDAFCALAWIHQEAPLYGFDTEHIVALGIEAGGNLAASLGLITDSTAFLDECPYTSLPDNPIAGVISYAGIYDFGVIESFHPTLQSLSYDYVRMDESNYEQRIREASPINYVHSDAPPFLLIHRHTESWLPAEHSEKLANALQEENITVEFIKILETGTYASGTSWFTQQEVLLDEIEDFIDDLLP